MTYYLRASLLILMLFVGRVPIPVQAQTAPVVGRLVGVIHDQQPCLTPSEHAEIQQMLQTKLALLNRNNPNSRKAAAHPVFSFPLRWAKEHAPYGFWTISNYVDLNPAIGPNDVNQNSIYNLDYSCGNRTDDQKSGYQHSGTDIALWPFNWSVMAGEYVKVVAAAPGVILSKSDGNDDQHCGSFNTVTSDWNAVYIRHDDGSVTWYGHLKRQSLTAKNVGQRVEEGEFLGFVGSSGRSSAPHMHFEVYNAEGKLIDPFQGACNKTITDAWWKEQPLYKDKTINRLSVHLIEPVMGVCPASANVTNEIVIAQPGQRFYFYTFGREEDIDDLIQFEVFQPDGQLFTIDREKSPANYANFYWALSATIPADAPTGQWTFRTTFNGKTYDKTFIVAKDIQSVVQIKPSGKTPFCAGDSVTLTANIDADQYIWKKDGIVLERLTDRKIVVYESGTYTAEISGAVSNSIAVVSTKRAAATLTGNQTIYGGQSANLSITFTGDGPWTVVYRDSMATGLGNPVTVTTDSNPYTVEVKPAKTTAYLLTGVSNACGNGSLVNRMILVTVSPLLGVDDPSLAAAVEVYPVPAMGSLTVRVNGLLVGQTAVLELADLSGHTIHIQETRQTTTWLSLTQQLSGLYVLRIRIGERVTSKRIVKL